MRSIVSVLGRAPRKLLAAGIILNLVLAGSGMAAPVTVVHVEAAPRPFEATVTVAATTLFGSTLRSEEGVVEPTGTIKRARARGTLNFSCCDEFVFCFCVTDWPKVIRIPAGTRVYTCRRGEPGGTGDDRCVGRGVGFKTLKDAYIRESDGRAGFLGSHRASRPVPIVALKAGPAGNVNGLIGIVEPSVFAGVKVFAQNGETSGGASGSERILTDADVDRTVEEITEKLLEEERREMAMEATVKGLVLGPIEPGRAVERNPVGSRFREPFADGPETVRVTISARALAYDPAAVDREIRADLPDLVPDGWVLAEGDLDYDMETARADEGLIQVDVRATVVPEQEALERILKRLGPQRAAAAIDSLAGVDARLEERFALPLQPRARIEIVLRDQGI